MRRGFSLLEAAVVLALVAIVSTASLLWWTSAADPQGDVAAKTSLGAFAQLQEQAAAEGRGIQDAADLAALDFSRTFVDAPTISTGPQEVSVAQSGTLAMAAVDAGAGICWMLRMDLEPTPSSPAAVWFVDVLSGPATCDASRVSGESFPDQGVDGDGATAANPIEL